MHYEFYPSGVCSMKIIIDTDGDVIKEVQFIGGCAGNTQGVASLCKGLTIDEVIKRLKGIDCRGRGTSCPDQLAQALEKMKEEKS